MENYGNPLATPVLINIINYLAESVVKIPTALGVM